MLSIENVTKTYRGRAGSLPVLTRVNLDVRRGELCALTGTSGSGKTTLMNLIGLLDRPDEGTIRLDGTDTAALRDDATAALRNRLIGFVFQAFHCDRVLVGNNPRPSFSATVGEFGCRNFEAAPPAPMPKGGGYVTIWQGGRIVWEGHEEAIPARFLQEDLDL